MKCRVLWQVFRLVQVGYKNIFDRYNTSSVEIITCGNVDARGGGGGVKGLSVIVW
jgi:hypothetical protein